MYINEAPLELSPSLLLCTRNENLSVFGFVEYRGVNVSGYLPNVGSKKECIAGLGALRRWRLRLELRVRFEPATESIEVNETWLQQANSLSHLKEWQASPYMEKIPQAQCHIICIEMM